MKTGTSSLTANAGYLLPHVRHALAPLLPGQSSGGCDIIGPGAVGSLIAQARQTAHHDFSLFGRKGPVATSRSDKPAPVIVVAVKCGQVRELINNCGEIWNTATTRIGAINGIIDEQIPGLRFDGFFSLSVGVTKDDDGKLTIVVAAPSWIVPVNRPFSPSVCASLTDIASDMTDMGVPTEVLNEPELGREFRWAKLFYNCVANPLSAITGLSMATLAATPGLGSVISGIVSEFNAVAEAAGVLFRGTIEKALAFLEQGRGHFPSTALDVIRGRSTEIVFLNGAISDLAARNGLEAPLNGLLVRLVTERVTLSARDLRAISDFTVSSPCHFPA